VNYRQQHTYKGQTMVVTQDTVTYISRWPDGYTSTFKAENTYEGRRKVLCDVSQGAPNGAWGQHLTAHFTVWMNKVMGMDYPVDPWALANITNVGQRRTGGPRI